MKISWLNTSVGVLTEGRIKIHGVSVVMDIAHRRPLPSPPRPRPAPLSTFPSAIQSTSQNDGLSNNIKIINRILFVDSIYVIIDELFVFVLCASDFR